MAAAYGTIKIIHESPVVPTILFVVLLLSLGAAYVYRTCWCFGRQNDDDDGFYREGGQKTRIRHEGGL